MGLDMYLNGKKFIWTNWDKPELNPTEDGFEVKERVLRLGYWRKHPNLHGYIVNTFADGVDECQEVDLSKEDLERILEAVEADTLPHTEGFFFGVSTAEDKPETIQILKNALKWLATLEDGISKSVHYQASW